METLVRRVASEKPESVTLPGSSWRSEIGYAEISHIEDNIVPFVCRVNSRGQAGVLVTGLEPARACAQRCERSLRLPVSPHQHLVGYEPRQSRRPRRETPHALPPAGPQYKPTRTSPVPRTREPDHKRALRTPGASSRTIKRCGRTGGVVTEATPRTGSTCSGRDSLPPIHRSREPDHDARRPDPATGGRSSTVAGKPGTAGSPHTRRSAG